MVFYICSNTYLSLISKVISETEQVCVGNEVGDDILLKKYVREHIRNFESVKHLIVDLTALADTDEEVINAFESLKVMDYDIHIIVLAARRREGEKFLKDCFYMGIYDLIVTDDFLQIKEQLAYALQVGMKYKDALHFRDAEYKEEEHAKERKAQKAVIGVIGSEPKIGCTHTCITLANTLRQMGYMVAVIEMGNKEAFTDIQEAFKEKVFPEGYYTVRGVDYYASGNKAKVESVCGQLYQFIILDFGDYVLADKLQFHKCDVRIVCAGAKPWELGGLQEIFKDQEEAVLRTYHYCYRFVQDKKLQKEIRREMEPLENIHFTAYEEDPFSSNAFPDVQNILKDFLPSAVIEEKKGFLKIFDKKNR